jgi:polyisoprenoid-binding protein YceI
MLRTLSICLAAGLAFSGSNATVAAPAHHAAAMGRTLSVQSAALSIDGTSTMHDYTLSTKTVTMNSTTALADIESLLQPGALQTLELQIPVDSFTSERDGLKKEMLKALHADKHPDITYKLKAYEIEPSAGGGIIVKPAGTLTVAGAERPIDLVLEVKETASGLQVRGRHDLSMKAFGVKPPTMFMGMLKTNDKVTIKFDLQLAIAPRVLASNGR